MTPVPEPGHARGEGGRPGLEDRFPLKEPGVVDQRPPRVRRQRGAAARSQATARPTQESTASGAVTLITSITITPGMNGVFEVVPPVKPGEDIWVKLKCVKSAPSPDEAGVLGGASTGDCKFLVAIRSYVLYRALQGDRHAVGASTEAQNELKNVYAYLGMQLKQEKAQENE